MKGSPTGAKLLPVHMHVDPAPIAPHGVWRKYRDEAPVKCIREPHEEVFSPLLVGSIAAHVRDEQVEQPVAIMVEEHGAGRVRGLSHASQCGDVGESSAALVAEEPVSVPHRRHEQVGAAIVVNVRARAPDRDDIDSARFACPVALRNAPAPVLTHMDAHRSVMIDARLR